MKCYWILVIWILGGVLERAPGQSADYRELLRKKYHSQNDEYIAMLKFLAQLEEHPLDINTVPLQRLLQIPFLDEQAARKITRHRSKYGTINNANDLLKILNMDRELLNALSPYITYQPLLRQRFFYQQRSSYKIADVPDALYFYQRFRWRPVKCLQIGGLMEKDSGEPRWSDLLSGYVKYDWEDGKSTLMVGDYNLRSGQGLVCGGSRGKLLNIASAYPFSGALMDVRPNERSHEHAFLRGVCWAYRHSGQSSLMLACSRRALDAGLDKSGKIVRSIPTSGYHRTPAEQQKRHRLKEKYLTGIFKYEFSAGSVGLQANILAYSLPIAFRERVYPPKNVYLSGCYNWQKGALRWQGEGALQNGKYPAFQQSFLLRTGRPRFFYAALFYYYHPDYYHLRSRAAGFLEQVSSNRIGYCLSLHSMAGKKTSLAACFQVSRALRPLKRFPFLKRGYQLQLLQTMGPSSLQVRFSQNNRRAASVSALPMYVRQTLRLHLKTRVGKSLVIGQRMEFEQMDAGLFARGDGGNLFYLDMLYHFRKRVSCQGRWTQFDLPGTGRRIYEFEHDLPGVFRSVMLTGRGIKWFTMLRCRFGKFWRIALKYREIVSQKSEASLFSSRKKQLERSRRREVRLQFSLKY